MKENKITGYSSWGKEHMKSYPCKRAKRTSNSIMRHLRSRLKLLKISNIQHLLLLIPKSQGYRHTIILKNKIWGLQSSKRNLRTLTSKKSNIPSAIVPSIKLVKPLKPKDWLILRYNISELYYNLILW